MVALNRFLPGVQRDVPAPRHLARNRRLLAHRRLPRAELLQPRPKDKGGEHSPSLLRDTKPTGGDETAAKIGRRCRRAE